jgi:quinol monooxygenase YgiN
MSEVIIIAKLTPREGRMNDLLEVFAKITPEFHDSEPGTLLYSVARPAEGDGPVVVIEKYASTDALEVHREHLTPHLPELEPLLAGEMDVMALSEMPFGDRKKRL